MIKNKRLGFTLIEVMVVFGIAVALAAVAFISIRGTSLSAMKREALYGGRDIANIVVQLEKERISVETGNYTPKSFYETYHIKIPNNPFDNQTGKWHIDTSTGYIYPVDANGNEIDSPHLRTDIYAISNFYAFKYEKFDSSYYDKLNGLDKKEESITNGRSVLQDKNLFRNYCYWQTETVGDSGSENEIESPYVIFKFGEVDLKPNGAIYQYSNISLAGYSSLFFGFLCDAPTGNSNLKIIVTFYKGSTIQGTDTETLSVNPNKIVRGVKIQLPSKEFDRVKIEVENTGTQQINLYKISVFAKIPGF